VYPNYDKKSSTFPRIVNLAVVVMGIVALLAPVYLLSSAQEAFATNSDDDDDDVSSQNENDVESNDDIGNRISDDEDDDDDVSSQNENDVESNDDIGSRIPSAYITIDDGFSQLQLENDNSSTDRIADYDIEPQGTISFGEQFMLLVPQTTGVLKNAESADLTVCYDEDCSNDDFWITRELIDVNDEESLYIETHVLDAPDEVGDGFTASEEGFEIFIWWTVSFTDGTDQTYVAIVHLQGDDCEEHGWVENTDGTSCVDPDE
jgi:hypothetical protein